MAVTGGGLTMPFMAKSPKKPAERSPSWKVFARLDPDLESRVEAYRKRREYPPTLSKVIERALKLLLEKDEAKSD